MARLGWEACMEAYRLSLTADGYSPYTIRARLSALTCLKRFCQERRVDPRVAPPALAAEWVSHLKTLYSPSTVHDYIDIARVYFRKEAPDSPFSRLHAPTVADPPVCPFTQAEVRRILGAASTLRDQAIILLLVGTGMRANELVNLEVDDVNFQSGVITIRNGKGNKQRRAAPGEYALAVLRRYLEASGIRRGYLFIGRSKWGHHRCGHFRADSLYKLIATLGRRAGVEKAHPHRFRHTFGCQFIRDANGDVSALQQLMGHGNIRMTIRYVEWNEQERALEVQRRCSPANRFASEALSHWTAPLVALLSSIGGALVPNL